MNTKGKQNKTMYRQFSCAVYLMAACTAGAVPTGSLTSISLANGPIVPGSIDEAKILGVADLFGNGSQDLFIGHDRVLPFQSFVDGIPTYGTPVALQSPLLSSTVDDSSLYFSAPFAAGEAYFAQIAIAAGRVKTYETSDSVSLEVVFNNGEVSTLGTFTGNASGTSGSLALDKDGDGVGDDLPLDVAFRSYTFPVPSGEWPITLRLRVDLDGNEEVGVDGIALLGASGSDVYTIAKSGFEEDDTELTFTTNIESGSVTANTRDFRGATLAGDGFNDYVAIAPGDLTLFSSVNLDLGFNNWEGNSFLILEDIGNDGLPSEVVLTFDQVRQPPLSAVYTNSMVNFVAEPQGELLLADGGGLEVEPLGDSNGVKLISNSELASAEQTWSAWVRVDSFETGSFSPSHPHGIINGYADSSLAAVLRLSSGQIQAGWYDGTRYLLSTTTETVPTGEWVHIATTSDGVSAAKIFLNGVEQTVSVSSGDPTSRPLAPNSFRIGYQSESGNTRMLDGAVRNVCIYTRTLSSDDLASIVASGPEAKTPIAEEDLLPGAIVEMPDGQIVSVSYVGNSLVFLKLNEVENRFEEFGRAPIKAGNEIQSLAARALDSGTIEIYAALGGKADYLPFGKPLYDEEFIPYDGAGIWLGGKPEDIFVRSTATISEDSVSLNEVTRTSNELGVPFQTTGMTFYEDGLMVGSILGMFYYYPIVANDLAERTYVWAGDPGPLQLSPFGSVRPVAVSGPATESDLLVQSDAGLRYYKQIESNSKMLIEASDAPEQSQAPLFFGKNAVLSRGMINGDSLPDIVAGNAAGELLWSQQSSAGVYTPPVPLTVGGTAYNYDAGFRGSIQGPKQGRLGYTAPTLFDWNNDGTLDIILSNISGDYYVLMGIPGSAGEFEAARPLYLDGLEFHATWRNQPAVTDWGGSGETSIVTFDPDDYLHLYRRYDDYNILDGGILLQDNGNPIRANAFAASGTGRVNLQIIDWDGDGQMDILAGANPETSIPGVGSGLPLNNSIQKATVLFLKNTGSNAAPQFAFPQILAGDEGPLYFGNSTCSPAAFRSADDISLFVANSLGVVSQLDSNSSNGMSATFIIF